MLDLTKFKVYIVGGYVRDRLLGRECNDHDFVVVGATPEDMVTVNGFRQVGADFPVFLHTNGDEYALARTERKTSPGYKGFAVEFDPSVTLESDLERRDLTINAMAREVIGWNEHDHAILSDDIIDPFGGLADLDNGVLRHVSEAFAEDPLRVLRVARFCARFAFTVHPDTMQLLKKLVESGEVNHLVPERVWAELEKALMEEYPARFFRTLDMCGASEVIIPELYRRVIMRGHALDSASLRKADLATRFSIMTSTLPTVSVVGLCERLRVPDKIKWQAATTSLMVSKINEHPTLTPEIILEILEEYVDGFRQADRMVKVATTLLFLDNPVINANMDRILRAIREARHVSFASLDGDQQLNLVGKQIRAAISVKRLEAIRTSYR